MPHELLLYCKQIQYTNKKSTEIATALAILVLNTEGQRMSTNKGQLNLLHQAPLRSTVFYNNFILHQIKQLTQ